MSKISFISGKALNFLGNGKFSVMLTNFCWFLHWNCILAYQKFKRKPLQTTDDELQRKQCSVAIQCQWCCIAFAVAAVIQRKSVNLRWQPDIKKKKKIYLKEIKLKKYQKKVPHFKAKRKRNCHCNSNRAIHSKNKTADKKFQNQKRIFFGCMCHNDNY